MYIPYKRLSIRNRILLISEREHGKHWETSTNEGLRKISTWKSCTGAVSKCTGCWWCRRTSNYKGKESVGVSF